MKAAATAVKGAPAGDGTTNYFFGVSNGPPCTGKATFSADESTVTLILTGAYPGQVFCDGTTPVTLVRKQ